MALTNKQFKVLELMTCGEGLSYREIANRVDVTERTIYRWKTDCPEFIEKFNEINDMRWAEIVDLAKESCANLLKNNNAKITEFVMKNAGYNPQQKVEVSTGDNFEITINANADKTES